MELTASAAWLNKTFAFFDIGILSIMHSLAEVAGEILTPFMTFISIFGKDGIIPLIIGLILTIYPKTRKIGMCILLSIIFGAIITNVTLKPLVARPRPYDTYDYVRQWWQLAGSSQESDLSFPSGHVTVITASLMGLCIDSKRWIKKSWHCYLPALIFIGLMCISRMYLMMHYPTDVIGGLISGLIGAIAANILINKVEGIFKKKISLKKYLN